MSKKLARRLEMARDLEGRGHLEHAAKAYVRAARPDEAARLFETIGRPADAAKHWVDAVALHGRAVAPELAPEGRAFVERACALYRQARREVEAGALEAALAGTAGPIPVAALDTGEGERAESDAEGRPSAAPPARDAGRPPSPSVDPAEMAPPRRPTSFEAARPPSPSVDPAAMVPPRPGSVLAGRPSAPPVDPLELAGAPRRPPSIEGPGVHRPSRPVPESVGVHRSRPASEEIVGRTSARPPARPSSFTVARPLGRPAPAREEVPRAPVGAPRTEAPRVEAPRAEAPRVEASRVEASRVEASRVEAPRVEAPRAEAPRAEAPRAETPRAETPLASSPTSVRPPARPAVAPPARPPSEPSGAPRLAELGAAPTSPTSAAPPSASSPGSPSPAGRSIPPAGMTRGPVGAPEKSDFARASGWRDTDGTEMEKTIASLLSQGKKGAAARVALEAGQHERALEWFVELELHHHAGLCLRALGRPAEALDAILRLSLGDTRYRRACFDVLELAKELGRLDFEVDRFLTRFVVDGPADPQENEAFLELARLYGQFGFPEGARRCAEAVLRASPGDVGAQMVLAAHPIETKPKRRSTRPPRPALSRDLPSLDAYRELVRAHAPK